MEDKSSRKFVLGEKIKVLRKLRLTLLEQVKRVEEELTKLLEEQDEG